MSEVSIHTFGEKIKGRVGEHRHTLLYALILIVVAGGAFYLGYSARASKTNDAQVAIYCPESAYMPSISQQGTSVAPTPSNAQNGAYIASKNGTKYYPADCSGASRIKEANRVYFTTEAEAVQAGYTRAQNCSTI